MINKLLSDLPSNEEKSEKAKPLYETTLNESGYETMMAYTKTTTNSRNSTQYYMI